MVFSKIELTDEEYYYEPSNIGDRLEEIIDDPVCLIPGSATFRWIKEDKSEISNMEKIKYTGYYLARDAVMFGVYSGIGYGLYSLASEIYKII